VDFLIEQAYDADPDAVARAYTEPGLYALIGEASALGRPDVLDVAVEDDLVAVEVRYHFTGELNSAARAAVDPAKLSWVEHSTHDLARRHVEFRLVPDHYGDRFRASGESTVTPGGAGTALRTARGGLTVRAPLVGRAVEKAIVSGLREHLQAEVGAVERYLAGRT
jgi:hypothetical protein